MNKNYDAMMIITKQLYWQWNVVISQMANLTLVDCISRIIAMRKTIGRIRLGNETNFSLNFGQDKCTQLYNTVIQLPGEIRTRFVNFRITAFCPNDENANILPNYVNRSKEFGQFWRLTLESEFNYLFFFGSNSWQK